MEYPHRVIIIVQKPVYLQKAILATVWIRSDRDSPLNAPSGRHEFPSLSKHVTIRCHRGHRSSPHFFVDSISLEAHPCLPKRTYEYFVVSTELDTLRKALENAILAIYETLSSIIRI